MRNNINVHERIKLIEEREKTIAMQRSSDP